VILLIRSDWVRRKCSVVTVSPDLPCAAGAKQILSRPLSTARVKRPVQGSRDNVMKHLDSDVVLVIWRGPGSGRDGFK
jgi:hypothetical protein